ncbi:MAG TPA: GAF domain-containing protein, partial [Terriglobales bacterium]
MRYRRAADGQYRWFLSRAVPLRSGKGEIVKWYGVSTDIEERKRAEQRLRESEAYLAEAQRLSQTGSWAWSPATGDIRYWSETCYRVLGFDPAGPLPRFEEFFLRIHPDDQAALRERFDKAIRDKADFELDYRVVHPEKGIRDIHAVGHAVLDGSSNLAEFVGTVIDVTERKRAEQELQQSETDLRTKNDRLKLLLNVTNQITSNLELQDLLRAISAGIRGIMRCDMVAITLPDAQTEGQRLVALDFPGGKGLIKEGLLLTPVGPGGRALQSLSPTVVSTLNPDAFSPEVREFAIAEGLQQHCVIPLANRGRALGALVVARTTDVYFSPDDLEFLAQVSGQIAIAIENALAFQKVTGLSDRLQLILNLTKRITSSLDLREVLRVVAANIRELIHADAVAFSQPDPTSGKFRLIAVDFPHGKGVLKEELLYTPGAAGKKAADTLKPVVGYAPALDERESSEVREIAAVEGMKAFCLIPLVNQGRFLGILSILRTTEAPFTPEDVEFLSRTSGQIAVAIDNALAFQKVSRLGDRLQLLLDLTNNITSSLDLREVLRAVAANIREVMQADAVLVVLPDHASGKGKVLAVDFPRGKGIIKEGLVFTPTTAVRRAIETLKPVVIATRERDELAPDTFDIMAAEGVTARCLIPLVSRGQALGILSILRTTETPFASEDVDLLGQASGQIAIAIENALAYQEISELKDKLAQEKLYLEEEIRTEMGFERIVGNSEALKHVLQLVETAAPSDSTVLLLGETGTGKELIARAIHDRSRRKQRTLVKLNCAAIPTGLLESELFGHEKGAFT